LTGKPGNLDKSANSNALSGKVKREKRKNHVTRNEWKVVGFVSL